jgi:translation initiation factor IF-1
MSADTPSTKEFLVVKGIVEENLPATMFRVKLENGQDILCYLSGKLRKHRIRLTPGDEVQIEISPYDLTKGRIVYRF